MAELRFRRSEMKVQTESRTSADLLRIVNEAVTEADVLRKRLERHEKTLLSTRLLMGHELKRPATAIKGYLDLALERIICANIRVGCCHSRFHLFHSKIPLQRPHYPRALCYARLGKRCS